MKLATLKKYILFTIVVTFCVSCGEPNKYNQHIKIGDPSRYKIIVNQLKEKDIEFITGEDGTIFYGSKDKESVLRIAFNTDVPEYKTQIPNYAKTWKITIDDAKEIVLGRYPDILKNAYISVAVTATLQSKINGFAKANEKVWHFRIVCDNGGIHALFFIHPISGKLFIIQSPDDKESKKCISK